ncbi:hypothetical protein BD311DRAFT_869690 [Dichomitus squalens]|uniref:F-box domain-containing protein n=1 Tax=Dichomitus squalens TaxID=114155 RepID=A0A4Q9M6I3_9APHY|nr:hypothetical protein BD311DRAFT_869690 [Dichomitus squalens]
MASPISPLDVLPSDVLDHIAFYVAVAEPRGPPCPLLPLLTTSSRIHYHLSIANNSHLYARIFRANFDHHAPARRFCEEATYSSALASQLVHYSRALFHIKQADIHSPTLLNDFYRLFALSIENDGRNARLLQWAALPQFLQRYIRHRLWAYRADSNGWPLESPENSFALWLYFFSLDQQTLAQQSEQDRHHFLFLLRPFAFYNFRYPPFLVPDNHVHLPLAAHPTLYHDHSAITPHGFYPLYRSPDSLKHSFEHFGRRIAVAEPPIGLVAKLLYIALHERYSIVIPDLIPRDRHEANALNVGGPTIADYQEFASHTAVHFPDPGHSSWRDDHNEEDGRIADTRAWTIDGKGESARHDNDWERWRGCLDPWDATRTKGPVYTPGSLSGFWTGQYLVPDVENYHVAMNSATFIPRLEHPAVKASVVPLFFRLREHHCVSPAVPLPHTEVRDNDPLDEGVMNAYFPRGFPDAYLGLPGSFSDIRRDGVLRLRQRGTTQEYVYETYVEGRANSHDEATCEMCRDEAEGKRAARMAEVGEQRESSVPPSEGSVGDVSDSDYESEAEDHVDRVRRDVQSALGDHVDLEELIDDVSRQGDCSDDSASFCDTASDGGTEIINTCSGVLDIIVTGETLPHHALAWGDFRIYGRVRSWDGLVVLVRAPIWDGPGLPPHDTFIFRGYVVAGRNLVGSWRHVTGNIHSIPLEGPFVVSKRDAREGEEGARGDEDAAQGPDDGGLQT